jgi:hypothetical protein
MDNPWEAEFWNLTNQGAYIKKYGVEVAKTKARQAGQKLFAPRKTGPKSEPLRVMVQRRNIVGTSSGSSGGSSGNGPP